ncbi:MAG: hypothetical protein HFE43_01210 [Oscillospiraceae bacterium]|nr:hypothetical protein [Oscillospiraceae bacterium]
MRNIRSVPEEEPSLRVEDLFPQETAPQEWAALAKAVTLLFQTIESPRGLVV